ncbi:MAG: EamA family transporter [Candidatus Auribacter fodinae]|jgi:drug/metabolite transporter (DMT)-like permease|uniref:EamA family transporter n=1 Tax=Candidatus Auribacter fodinae TaxID=2093366 RepID=A0A3A4R4G0_9BACT|nr:MAG: EamA family transporter [Candidatus Auribacter fodinae]
MIWSFIALISSFSVSIADCMTKKYLSNESVWITYWIRIGYSVPVLLLFMDYSHIPHLPAPFWWIMAALVPLETIAGLFYARALQISPLSLTIPFMAFSPVFLLGVGYLILGEVPSYTGLCGVLLVAGGAYLLNVHHSPRGLLAPIKAILHERGSWMMLIVAVLYTFSATLGKKALTYAEPRFFAFFYMAVVAVACFPVMYMLSGRKLRLFVHRPLVFLMVGTAMGVMVITHFVAVENMHVAYMVSIKRLNLVFSVFLGHWMFNEERLMQNSLACIMMLCGAIIITVL